MLFHIQFLGLELVVSPVKKPEESSFDKLLPFASAALPAVMAFVRERFSASNVTNSSVTDSEESKVIDALSEFYQKALLDTKKAVRDLGDVVSTLVARVDALENPGAASNGADVEADQLYVAAQKSL